MFTTAGDTVLAMVRKVLASIVPLRGALFIGGTATDDDWAAEAGVDFVKFYTQLGPEMIRAGIEEAQAAGVRTIHVAVDSESGEATELPDKLAEAFGRRMAPGG